MISSKIEGANEGNGCRKPDAAKLRNTTDKIRRILPLYYVSRLLIARGRTRKTYHEV